MAVLSKIDNNDSSINWADELDVLFDSMSIPKSDPLPIKFHRFVHELYGSYTRGELPVVPSPAWFKQVIPNKDPKGIAYYALIHLQDLVPEYQPDEKPLEECVYQLLLQACAEAHDAECGGSLMVLKIARASETAAVCDVCRLEDALVKLMDKDPVLKLWDTEQLQKDLDPDRTPKNTLFEEFPGGDEQKDTTENTSFGEVPESPASECDDTTGHTLFEEVPAGPEDDGQKDTTGDTISKEVPDDPEEELDDLELELLSPPGL